MRRGGMESISGRGGDGGRVMVENMADKRFGERCSMGWVLLDTNPLSGTSRAWYMSHDILSIGKQFEIYSHIYCRFETCVGQPVVCAYHTA